MCQVDVVQGVSSWWRCKVLPELARASCDRHINLSPAVPRATRHRRRGRRLQYSRTHHVISIALLYDRLQTRIHADNHLTHIYPHMDNIYLQIKTINMPITCMMLLLYVSKYYHYKTDCERSYQKFESTILHGKRH